MASPTKEEIAKNKRMAFNQGDEGMEMRPMKGGTAIPFEIRQSIEEEEDKLGRPTVDVDRDTKAETLTIAAMQKAFEKEYRKSPALRADEIYAAIKRGDSNKVKDINKANFPIIIKGINVSRKTENQKIVAAYKEHSSEVGHITDKDVDKMRLSMGVKFAEAVSKKGDELTAAFLKEFGELDFAAKQASAPKKSGFLSRMFTGKSKQPEVVPTSSLGPDGRAKNSVHKFAAGYGGDAPEWSNDADSDEAAHKKQKKTWSSMVGLGPLRPKRDMEVAKKAAMKVTEGMIDISLETGNAKTANHVRSNSKGINRV